MDSLDVKVASRILEIRGVEASRPSSADFGERPQATTASTSASRQGWNAWSYGQFRNTLESAEDGDSAEVAAEPLLDTLRFPRHRFPLDILEPPSPFLD